MVALVFLTTITVANTCWLFDIKDISLFIPTVLTLFEGVFAVSNEVWTVLLKECKHRGATWTTVEPNDQWVSSTGFLLTLNEEIMNVLFGVWKVDVSRIHAPIFHREIRILFGIQ